MPIILSPSANPFCNDWNNNFGIVNTALTNAEILNQGLLTLTRVDGTTFNNNIPFFMDHVTSGLATSLSDLPNPRSFVYTSGTYQIGVNQYTIGVGSNFQINAGDLTNPRVDIVYLTTTNTLVYLPGIAAANPVAPTPPANTLILSYIGVNANATTIAGITLTQVNISGQTSNVSNGILINQTLRWNGVAWVPNSGMLANTIQQVSIGGISGLGTMDAATKLQVGGAVNIEPIGLPPAPVTDKLYNIGGNLYWNGFLLTGYTGTVVGSHLRWNGVAFVEETNFLTLSGINSSWDCRFNSNDTAGINTVERIGIAEASGFRGFSRRVSEPGNLTEGYEEFSLAYGGLPEYDRTCTDNNTGDNAVVFQSPTVYSSVVTDGVSTTSLQQSKNQIRLNGGMSTKTTLITVDTALTDQYICLVRTSTGARILTLPGVTTIDGTTYVIKDVDGLALNNNITIIATGGATIEGNAGFIIASNRTSITIVYSSALNLWAII